MFFFLHKDSVQSSPTIILYTFLVVILLGTFSKNHVKKSVCENWLWKGILFIRSFFSYQQQKTSGKY